MSEAFSFVSVISLFAGFTKVMARLILNQCRLTVKWHHNATLQRLRGRLKSAWCVLRRSTAGQRYCASNNVIQFAFTKAVG